MPILKFRLSVIGYRLSLIFPILFVLPILLLIATFYLLPTTIYAQTATTSATPSTTISTASAAITTPVPAPSYQPLGYVAPNSPQYTNQMVYNLIHTFSCFATGRSIIDQPCIEYVSVLDSTGVNKLVPMLTKTNNNGLLGSLDFLVFALYDNKPLNTSEYLANLGSELGLVEEVRAQVPGGGSGVLNPILTLWQVSRNISYAFMTIIFVVIGLMVMFRSKINPQTVISVQAALPGLVVGLILITFSYFFASLITDVAFLSTNIVGYYFQLADATTLSTGTPFISEIRNDNVFSLMGKFMGATSPWDLNLSVGTMLNSLEGWPYTIVITAISFVAYQYGAQMATPLAGIVGGILSFIPAVGPSVGAGVTTLAPAAAGLAAATWAFFFPQNAVSLAIYVIAIFILIYTMVKLLMQLVNNYLTIVFLTITAPFQFLVASLPGRQELATDWARNMLCNVLAFPAVLAVFYFVAYLIGPTIPQTPFQATGPLNLTGGGALPLFGGLNLDFIRVILAYGALIATPAIPGIICEAIGKMGRSGQMIENEISGAIRAGQGYSREYAGNAQKVGGSLGQAGTALFGSTERGFEPGIGWTSYRKKGLIQQYQAHREKAAEKAAAKAEAKANSEPNNTS